MPPIAVVQSTSHRLIHRHRGQAPSHIWICVGYGLLGIQVHWGNNTTIFLRLPQVGIDEVHTVVFQLSFVHQVVLDGTRAILAQLTLL